jgi:hypothetical protein
MEVNTDVPTLIILDDVMSSINNSNKLEELFTRGVHHRKVSVILTLQNLFYHGTVMKTLRDNAMYIALTKHIQDVSKLDTFARQLECKNSNYFKEAYQDAVSQKYGYLMCDLHPHSNLRDDPLTIKYRTLINKPEGQILYIPKGQRVLKAVVKSKAPDADGMLNVAVQSGKNIPDVFNFAHSTTPNTPQKSQIMPAPVRKSDGSGIITASKFFQDPQTSKIQRLVKELQEVTSKTDCLDTQALLYNSKLGDTLRAYNTMRGKNKTRPFVDPNQMNAKPMPPYPPRKEKVEPQLIPGTSMPPYPPKIVKKRSLNGKVRKPYRKRPKILIGKGGQDPQEMDGISDEDELEETDISSSEGETEEIEDLSENEISELEEESDDGSDSEVEDDVGSVDENDSDEIEESDLSAKVTLIHYKKMEKFAYSTLVEQYLMLKNCDLQFLITLDALMSHVCCDKSAKSSKYFQEFISVLREYKSVLRKFVETKGYKKKQTYLLKQIKEDCRGRIKLLLTIVWMISGKKFNYDNLLESETESTAEDEEAMES